MMKYFKIVRQNLTILEHFFMVKYSLDFKLNVVKGYFNNNLGVNYLTKKYHILLFTNG